MVKIPWQSLSPEALQGVIDAFVLKEGTDYGVSTEAPSLNAKRASVTAQLEDGSALIVFDPVTESTDLILAADLPTEFPTDLPRDLPTEEGGADSDAQSAD